MAVENTTSCTPDGYGTLVIVVIAVNTLVSLAVVAVNGILFYKLHVRQEAVQCINECTEAFQKTLRAAHFMRIPLVGVILLAEIAGMNMQEVIHEYEKDSMERKAIVYGTLGKTALVQRFIDLSNSNFMRDGYDGESLLLKSDKGTGPGTDAPLLK
ncbi:hypothetical protein AAVH_11725 [Aphelenchoides avenae]|nr:hypothetical protein AAVH_11725 [Aphelenchus avenae]